MFLEFLLSLWISFLRVDWRRRALNIIKFCSNKNIEFRRAYVLQKINGLKMSQILGEWPNRMDVSCLFDRWNDRSRRNSFCRRWSRTVYLCFLTSISYDASQSLYKHCLPRPRLSRKSNSPQLGCQIAHEKHAGLVSYKNLHVTRVPVSSPVASRIDKRRLIFLIHIVLILCPAELIY